MMQAEGQRERRTTVKHLRNSIAHLIAALEKELAELDRDIDDTVRGSPVWREKEDLLASVPGVGPKTAHTLIADLPELSCPIASPWPASQEWRQNFAGAGSRASRSPGVRVPLVRIGNDPVS